MISATALIAPKGSTLTNGTTDLIYEPLGALSIDSKALVRQRALLQRSPACCPRHPAHLHVAASFGAGCGGKRVADGVPGSIVPPGEADLQSLQQLSLCDRLGVGVGVGEPSRSRSRSR